MDLKSFGKNLIIKGKSDKKNKTGTKDYFVAIMNLFDELNQRSEEMVSYGIDMEVYDDAFFILIENLIQKLYGDWKSEIMIWYVYDRIDENEELLPLLYSSEDQPEEKEIFIETPEQLWEFIKKVEKETKK
jgi:hypothetical protein